MCRILAHEMCHVVMVTGGYPSTIAPVVVEGMCELWAYVSVALSAGAEDDRGALLDQLAAMTTHAHSPLYRDGLLRALECMPLTKRGAQRATAHHCHIDVCRTKTTAHSRTSTVVVSFKNAKFPFRVCLAGRFKLDVSRVVDLLGYVRRHDSFPSRALPWQ